MEKIKNKEAGSSVKEETSVPEDISISFSILKRIPYEVAIQNFVVPFSVDEKGRLEVFMAYPENTEMLQAVQFYTEEPVKPVKVTREHLIRLISVHYNVAGPGNHGSKSDSGSRKRPGNSLSLNISNNTSAINIVNDIIQEAIKLKASDIHFEPFEREMVVRFRIDGVLQEMCALDSGRIPEILSRIKIMSSLDIAEKRRSQDGRISINENNRDVDIRVSTLPTDFGEKIVMRILDKSSFDFDLEKLGIPANRLGLFKKAVQMPNGIILITGPTGSGKTTTLYGTIDFLKKPGLNISTVEDPIEYNIPEVNQTQVKPEIDMTFARLLRTMLRQDPNVIMVGEMRDRETADIAIRSSLTGHLVLSTLHTNDSASAVTRLVDIGVEPYLVASSLTMIVAQRLVRRICEHCRCEDDVSGKVKRDLGLTEDEPVYKGLGCPECGYTGYRGRTGIYEMLPVSEEIRKLINDKAYTSDLRNHAVKEGLITLRDDGLSKLKSGVTSIEEITREISVIA